MIINVPSYLYCRGQAKRLVTMHYPPPSRKREFFGFTIHSSTDQTGNPKSLIMIDGTASPASDIKATAPPAKNKHEATVLGESGGGYLDSRSRVRKQ